MSEIWDNLITHPASRSRAVPGFDSAKLRHLRIAHAMLTQAELARAAGISRGAVSHLEQGRRQPMVTTLRGLCLALNCDPGDLISDEGIEHDAGSSRPAATADAASGNSSREGVRGMAG